MSLHPADRACAEPGVATSPNAGVPVSPDDSDPPGAGGIGRRAFLGGIVSGVSAYALGLDADAPETAGPSPDPAAGVKIADVRKGEDLFAWIERAKGRYDRDTLGRLLGAANEFKEGDQANGLAAADRTSRENARALLSNTRIGDLAAHPLHVDETSKFGDSVLDPVARARVEAMTMGELKAFLLAKDEADIKALMPGMSSDAIACVVKLMSEDELIAVGRKVFNPLPGSKVGAKGYMGARVQPNSPTDHPDDIQFQVFDAFAYAVGDVVLGTNPVSSEVAAVRSVEEALKDVLDAFGLADTMPHCVLSHVDVQAEVEKEAPGSTALWFQSLGGVDGANRTFDVTVEKMIAHAASRTGRYGLYFETGQGADGTNGHSLGFDMVIHESRKYGFARALKAEVAKAQRRAGREAAPWVHLNDVAGFIGPEVFRSKEQLVRVCLEDTVMGKLHGLPIGLDICSTLHMDVSLDDLDWCIDRVMPANPAYLMALPTKNDPMLSYLTTAYQDHVRIRSKFGYKVDDRMWAFYRKIGVIDAEGKPTKHFGDPAHVYLQYRRAKKDDRSDEAILAEAKAKMAEVRGRGVFLAEGHGANPWDMDPKLDKLVRDLYADAKICIHAELPANFAATFPAALEVRTRSKDREDYILHPPTGEALDEASEARVADLRDSRGGRYDVQIVVTDGLDALALTDPGHLAPYLEGIRAKLEAEGRRVAPETIVVNEGRVRAGYRIGEILFGSLPDRAARGTILHVIGERPGNGHHTYSVYITSAPAEAWGREGAIDHDITKVVANIADTALLPTLAAEDTATILRRLTAA